MIPLCNPDVARPPVQHAVVVALLLAGAAARVVAQPLSGRVLLATVTDRGNRFIVDVGADDFVVEEGGQNCEVLDVHPADYPVAILIDNGPDSIETLSAVKNGVKGFIERLGQRPVAVGSLVDGGSSPSFEADRATVLASVDRLTSLDTRLHPLRAIAHAARALRDTEAPFAAIVVVAARPEDASDAAELLPAIVESGIAVSVIASRAGGPIEAGQIRQDLLRLLADQTRGHHTAVFATASYGSALERLADRFAAELLIEYLVPAGSQPGEVRAGVRIPGARLTGLRTR
jgi:hypothetical protein